VNDVLRPHVVAIAGDPGGAAALAPVLQALCREDRVDLEALAYRQAKAQWKKCGIRFKSLLDVAGDQVAAPPPVHIDADLLLTATSVNGVDLEKKYTAAARQAGIPSLALLDFWTNYTRRFADESGQPTCQPDLIAVMDDRAREEMAIEGFARNRIVITGQPAYDNLAAWRRGFTQEKRARIRESLGANHDDLVVLFVSQPLASLYGSDTNMQGHPGYTEWTVLSGLVDAIEQIAGRERCHMVLAIRPHPREDALAFKAIRSDLVTVLVAADGESRELVMSSDLVVGMNSALLVEACYLGCAVVSLQPGLRVADALPTNRVGASIPVYRREDIEPMLSRLMSDHEARGTLQRTNATLAVDAGATGRVVKLIYQLVGIDQPHTGDADV
jgi:hypothetical protein